MFRRCGGGEVTSRQDAGVKFIFPARVDADRKREEDVGMNGGAEGREAKQMRSRQSEKTIFKTCSFSLV